MNTLEIFELFKKLHYFYDRAISRTSGINETIASLLTPQEYEQFCDIINLKNLIR